MPDLDYGSLPVITDEISQEFIDEALIDYDDAVDPNSSWSQAAVDFACLVTGSLSDKIAEQAQRIEDLKKDLDNALSHIENITGVDRNDIDY